MTVRDQMPISPADPPIVQGDTGDAVKIFQDFLQNDPVIKKELDFIGTTRGSFAISLLDSVHYGIFEKDTYDALRLWQKPRENDIVKLSAGAITNFGQIYGKLDFFTWKLMSNDAAKQEEIPLPSSTKPIPVQEPIPDPPLASKALNATHYVKTEDPKSRLALREAVAYVAVSKNASEDNDKKGKLVIMMPNDVLLRVIEPHLGYKCQWHQVEIIDSDSKFAEIRERQKKEKFYAYAEFIYPLNGTPELLPIQCCEENEVIESSKLTFVEWQNLDECEPFKDGCFYYITVTTDDENTSTALLPQQKKKALKKGVEQLLEFYDKIRDQDFVNKLLSSYQFAQIDDNGWNLDKRPNSKLKFLVKIPSKYFDAIPRTLDDLGNLAVIESELPNDWRTTNFTINTLKPNIELVVKQLEQYVIDIDNWVGSLPQINLTEEIKQLNSFPAVLKEFVILNGYEYDEKSEKSIEIGFEGPCFNLLYVLIEQNGKSVPLKIGLECFKKKEPIRYQNTMGFVFYLEDIARESKKEKKKNWIEFLQSYICPVPEINPSKREPSAIQSTDSIKRLEKSARSSNCTPFKTVKLKSIEDLLLSDPIFKQRVADERKNQVDFVGDNILSCDNIPVLLNRINTIDDVYSEVFNKVDIKDVASFVASCLLSKIDLSQLEKIAAKIIFAQMKIEELNKFIENLPEKIGAMVDEQVALILSKIPFGIIKKLEEIKREVIQRIVSEVEFYETLFLVAREKIINLINQISIPAIPSCEEILSKLPKIPVITIPDDLSTEDIMSDILPSIENAVKNMLSDSLISIVKATFKMICEVCEDDVVNEKYGDANINDIIKKSFSNNPDRLNVSPSSVSNELFINLGIPLDILEDRNRNILEELFNDLSLILTPSEICMLLNGTISSTVLSVITNLIKSKYSELEMFLSTPNKVKQLFNYLGKFVDKTVCEKVVKEVPNRLCSDNVVDDLRKNLLISKMSPEQATQQINLLKDKQEKQLIILAKVIQGNLLENTIPSIMQNFCSKTGNFGIISKDPASVEYLNDKVLGTMFDGVSMAFNQDVVNYAEILIGDRKIQDPQNNDDFKKSHLATIKPIDNINSNDTEALLKNPLATGFARGQETNIVAPELFNILINANNFSLVSSDINETRADYIYNAPMVNEFQNIEKSKKGFFGENREKEFVYNSILNELANPNLTTEEKLLKSQFVLNQTTAIVKQIDERQKQIDEWDRKNKTAGGETFTTRPEPVCFPDIPEQDKLVKELFDFAERRISNKKASIEYSLPSYNGEREISKINYFIKINDITLENPTILVQQDEVDPIIANKVIKYELRETENASIEQQVFAELVKSKWEAVVEPSVIDKLSVNTPFYDFFRDTTFHRITNWFMSRMSLQTSASRLFVRKNLENIEFVPEQNDDGFEQCALKPVETKMLFDIEKIKEDVKNDYNKMLMRCEQKSLEEDTISEFEKAGMGGVVQSMIRLFVADIMLRGIFVWTEFKIDEILSNSVISDFIFNKVKRDLQEEGEEFYQRFAIEARDYLLLKGNKAIDFNTDQDQTSEESKEDVVLSNPIHPDNQSGEAAIKFLVKEQMKNVSEWMKNLLDSSQIEDLEKRFLNQWLFLESRTPTSVFTNALDVRNYVKRYNLPFVFERYVRTCDPNTETSIVKSPDIDIEKTEKLSYGVRLTYVPPINQKGKNDKNPFEGISFRNNKDIEDEKSFKFNSVADFDKPGQNLVPNVYPFVLVSVEEEKTRIGRASIEEELEIFEKLKNNMINTEEWKMLFRFCFPLNRLLALNAIYNIMVTSISIEDIEHVFDSTKMVLKSLQYTLLPSSEGDEWWKKTSPLIEGKGGNVGIRAERMNNITTNGSTPSLKSIAKATIGIMMKGFAEKYDPSYKLIKTLFDNGAAVGGLTFGSIPQVLPINIFGPFFGFGPPIGPYGVAALNAPLLSGEKKIQKRNEQEKKLLKSEANKENNCDNSEDEEK